MINIICNSAECYIENNVEANLLYKDIYKEISHALSYTDKNKAYIKIKNKDARWSDNIQTAVSLYDPIRRAFPRGLLNLVVKVLVYYDIDFEIIHTSVFNLIRKSNAITTPDWAYTHQVDIIRECLNGKNGIISAPPCSGKSNAIAWLLDQFVNPKALIVVPRINLCNQLYDTLIEILPNLKIDKLSGEDKTFDVNTQVLVAVAPSAAKLAKSNPEVFNSVNILCYDEVQKAINETFRTILYSCINTEYKLGFSGTPLISLLSKAYFGDIQLKIEEKVLVDNNIIVEPSFVSYIIPNPNIRYPYIKTDDNILYVDDKGRPTFNNKPPYYNVYTNSVALNKKRNQTIVDISKYLLHLPTRKGPIIIFIEWQDVHGNELLAMYKAANIDITFLSGLTSTKERDRIIKDLREEKLDIVLATNVIAEGTNIINLEFAVIADGKKSTDSVIQKIGRVIRKDVVNNKTRCVAIDISDTDQFYLSSAASSRKRAFIDRYGDKKLYKASTVTELNTILNTIK